MKGLSYAPLRYGSICSGVEALTLAWRPLGFRAAFFAETDAQCSAVLHAHYPATPNYGDFRTIPRSCAPFDILAGGTPCQSFSTAGRRGGMADPRGNLALEFVKLARRFLPRWIVWENVPGVLSSGQGEDFARFLDELAGIGYLGSWRILDALRVGGCPVHGDERGIGPVPQRRRRVFVVAYLGSWEPAAQVLFDPYSVRRDHPPRRQAQARAAGGAEDSARTLNGKGGTHGTDTETFIAGTLNRNMDRGTNQQMAHTGLLISGSISRHYGQRNQPAPDEMHSLVVAHSLSSEGHDASEDGTGRGIPLVFSCKDYGNDCGESAPVLRSMNSRNRRPNGGGQLAIAYDDAVRHLTPRECERLMGFPDDYTLVKYKGKLLEDSPRYGMIGNSIAIPPLRWIGKRLAAVDRLIQESC